MRNNVAVHGARWFFPNGNQVRTEVHSATGPNVPYFRNIFPTPLIIRKFVHPYNGTYSCGPNRAFNDASLHGDTISLTCVTLIVSKIVIIIIIHKGINYVFT